MNYLKTCFAESLKDPVYGMVSAGLSNSLDASQSGKGHNPLKNRSWSLQDSQKLLNIGETELFGRLSFKQCVPMALSLLVLIVLVHASAFFQ